MIRKSVLKYMTYGWGGPAIIVAICIGIEFGFPYLKFGYRFDPNIMLCWITNSFSNIVVFGVPLALILIANTGFFVCSILAIHRVSAQFQSRQSFHSSRSIKSNTAQTATPSTRFVNI